jgi:hypothetical protein
MAGPVTASVERLSQNQLLDFRVAKTAKAEGGSMATIGSKSKLVQTFLFIFSNASQSRWKIV